MSVALIGIKGGGEVKEGGGNGRLMRGNEGEVLLQLYDEV
jgi:hypothetical protein